MTTTRRFLVPFLILIFIIGIFRVEASKAQVSYTFLVSAETIIVGDPTQASFKPVFTLPRWGGEASIRLGFDDSQIINKNVVYENNTVKWQTPLLDFNYYISPKKIVWQTIEGNKIPFTQDQGLEFLIILKQRPLVNSIAFQITSQGVTWHYQGPLDPVHPNWADSDKDGKADTFRPDFLVGSWVAYSAKWGNKYGTGKVYQIPRPLLVDAIGATAWANITIIGTTLTLALPSAFLLSATYPVKVDPTFGYSTQGGSAYSVATGQIVGGLYTLAEAGTVTKVGAFWYTGGTDQMKANFYDTSYAAKGAAPEFDSGLGEFYDWAGSTYDPGLSLSAADYYITWWQGDPGNYLYFDTVGGNTGKTRTTTYDGWPDPITFTSTLTNYKFSFNATYTATGGGQEYSFSFTETGQTVGTLSIGIERRFWNSESGIASGTSAFGLERGFNNPESGAASLSTGLWVERGITNILIATTTSVFIWGQEIVLTQIEIVKVEVAHAISYLFKWLEVVSVPTNYSLVAIAIATLALVFALRRRQ